MFTQCHLSGWVNLGAVCSPNGLNTFSNMQMEYLKLFGTLCFYSKYLAPNIYIRVEYPRYDVNYLKIWLGSLYPNVIQIFALKYTKIFPSLPTWKFISVTFPVHNSWHRGGIWNVSLWIIIKIIMIIILWSWNNVKSISWGTWEDEGDRGPKRFTFPRYFHQSTSIIIIVIKHLGVPRCADH